ncbi:MAG: aminoacyl-tRNA hydrolase [Bacteroidia bacterium]
MKYVIVGLGNPGAEYVDTRHNVGFMVLNRLAEHFDVQPEANRYAFTAKARYRGKQLSLVMPTTFMNLSGKAVQYYLQQTKTPIQNLMVVTDDLAIPFGHCRMKPSGSDGGHNGLKDIQAKLGTGKYPRLKVGIGNEFPRGGQVEYVLSDFTNREFEALPTILDYCVDGILKWIGHGIQQTMNDFNAQK